MAWWIERRARHALAGVLGRIVAGNRRPPGSVDLAAVRRVLVVRSNLRLGNLLLVTPALAAIRRAIPEGEIDLLTGPAYAVLLRGNRDVNRVWTVGRTTLARPWSAMALVRRIRRRSYDLVIDGSDGASLSGALLAAGSGGRWTVGPTPSRHERFFDVAVPRPTGTHLVEALEDVLAGVGIPPGGGMKVVLEADEERWAAARLEALGLPPDRPLVGVNVGARGEKRWPVERFLEVVDRIRAGSPARLVVFSGPEDRRRLASLAGRLPADVAVAPTCDVRRFAALLARCAVVVTGDTGPMHLAAAVGTPTVAVFLRDDLRTYAPRGEPHRWIRATPEAGADEVAGAVLEVLAASAAAGRRRVG